MRQIDLINDLYRRFKGDKELVIQAYATAERKGEVKRVSNKYEMTAEEYARRLYYNTFLRKR
jgi:hypothetical protein